MEKDLILTCDAGTTASKCTLFRKDGTALCAVRKEYTTEFPRPNWSEQSPDKVLASIIRQVEAKGVNSAVIFTSDHGEDIFDDERGRFLHASPIPTYYQLRVPLLVWTSQNYATQYPDAVAQLKSHVNMPVATNMVIFHTLLDLSGIETPYKKTSLSLCNKAFQPHKRLYINDHNEFMPLDDCGLKQIDIDQFKRHNLQFP